MKSIVLYDRYEQHNKQAVKLHQKLIDDCKKMIEGNGKLAGVFIDNCNRKVPLEKRSGYSAMREMCRNNNIDEVYVTSMSRLNRDIKYIINMCRDMHGYGIKVNFVNENVTSEQMINSSAIKQIIDGAEQEIHGQCL